MRTVVVPLPIPASLRQALLDVRAAVNHLIGDWRAHPDESRFHATKRSYRSVRQKYPHLASSWTVTIANETSATLASWDRVLRRMKRLDPKRWDRCRTQPPRRARLKAVLHPALYRLHGNTLDLTLSPSHHVQFDLAPVKNPLFRHYGEISHWKFGLTVTDRALVFHFHTPEERREGTGMVGVDVNMPSADYATTEGVMGSIDLTPIPRIQGAMARKRQRVQRAIPTDHRLQRLHLRRLKGRERRRVDPLLHMAANRLVAEVGDRAIVLEDLSKTQEELRRQGSRDQRRRLAVWTHGRFQRFVEYKARTHVLHVNPRGTSSECPRCGGRLDHPEWQRSICGNCQGDWHRDMAAATSILSRGQKALRGTALSPSALHALLEAAGWRPNGSSGPLSTPVKGDEANATLESLES